MIIPSLETVLRRALQGASGLVLLLALPAATQAAGAAIDWSDRYDGPDHLAETARAVVAGPAGSVYVAGSSGEWVDPSLATTARVVMRIGADGSRLWERRDRSGASGSWIENLAVDSSGNLLVLSTEQPFADVVVDKISPAGELLWSRSFAPPSGNFARGEGLAAGPGDTVQLTWFEYNLGDVGAVAKLSSTGTTEWTRRYPGPSGGATPAAVAVDTAGAVYVAGSAVVGDGADFALWKYSPAGDFQWVATAGSLLPFADDRAVDLAIDGATVVAAGTFGMNSGLGNDLAVARFDAAGQTLSVTTSRDPAGDSDWAYGMTVAGDGRIYVAGASELGPNHLGPVLAAFDAAGTVLWSRSFDGGVVANGYFFAVACDSAGHPYAAGYDSNAQTGETFFVAALAADGAPVWTSRHVPVAGQPSGAAALAIAADDSVVVAGDTWYALPAGGYDRDLVTVKFHAAGIFIAGFESGDTAEWSAAVE